MPSGLAITSWQWILDNRHTILGYVLQHAELTVVAVGIGLLISLPLAVWGYRRRSVYGPITWVTGLLYTIPSIALFSLLVPITGLTFMTAEVALVSYTLLILIRNIVTGLRGVPADVKEAATGMGYTGSQVLWRVEFPLALPAIVAGVRVATISTIGLITIAALIGYGGLGQLILEGINRLFVTEMLVGVILSVVLALLADAVLLVAERLMTPWSSTRAREIMPPRPPAMVK
ncbi:MAG TPA: ABC transporter permease [Actinomycetota bacterium]